MLPLEVTVETRLNDQTFSSNIVFVTQNVESGLNGQLIGCFSRSHKLSVTGWLNDQTFVCNTKCWMIMLELGQTRQTI